MLSFKSGIRLCDIVYKDKKATKSAPHTIYVRDNEDGNAEITGLNRDELLPSSFYGYLSQKSPENFMRLKKAIRESKKGLLDNNLNLMSMYDQAQDKLKSLVKKNFKIPTTEGHLEVAPMLESTRIAVFCPSGVVKSTWISKFIKTYLKYYPDNQVYVFSPKINDPAFKDIKKLSYVKIDASILKDVLDVSEFKDSICLFDDIESISDKKLNESVRKFRDQCYEVGRSPSNITTIAVHHVILANDKTKIILNESDEVVLFPKSNFSAISNLCKRYYGFGKDELNYLKNVPSRWVCVKRSFPTTIISEQEIKVI